MLYVFPPTILHLGIHTLRWNVPSGFGVAVVVGGLVVLGITGAIPTMDEALTENPPSVPLLAALRNIERTQSSVTIDVNFTTKSTIRLPHL